MYERAFIFRVMDENTDFQPFLWICRRNVDKSVEKMLIIIYFWLIYCVQHVYIV